MSASNPNLNDIFTDVANAIRTKKGTSNTICPLNFADEVASIVTGGGDKPQLFAPTISISGKMLTIVDGGNGSFSVSYAIYANDSIIATVSNPGTVDLTTYISTAGVYSITCVAKATDFEDSVASNIASMTAYAVSANIVNGTASGDVIIVQGASALVTVTPNANYYMPLSISVSGATYAYDVSNNIGYIALTNPSSNVSINVECTDVEPSAYIIGIRGMTESDPALTRTDSATGATWATSNNAIEVTGLDMTKIWGGYIGNDGEELTWDASTNKYMLNGEVYTGNVFSKINRFFIKPTYVDVSGVQTLDGFKLAYANEAPDDTYQDWFYGKSYVGIGCYKAVTNLSGKSAMVSKQNCLGGESTSASNIIASYKLASTTNGSLHEKWFNENAIMQVLFMVIFATRQTADVFPTNTWNTYASCATGRVDSMRALSSIASGHMTGTNVNSIGNIFLGIEDVAGNGYEIIAGFYSRYRQEQVTMDYANFSYDKTYSSPTIHYTKSYSYTIKTLQVDNSVPGLMLPYDTLSSKTSTYFCNTFDYDYRNDLRALAVCGNSAEKAWGIFKIYMDFLPTASGQYRYGRLCRTPA